MNAVARPYLFLSATIFSVVAVAHVVRAATGASLLIGGWYVPMAPSWIAAVVVASIAVWGFKLARQA